MKLPIFLFAFATAQPILADAVEEVRQAEIGFAKAFADRDKAKFFSYVADDAVFMSALSTLRGRAQTMARWSRFFDGVPVAPFSWGPERVEVTGDGRIGFSMGPIYDDKGGHGGYYSSVWQKQGDGTWKVVLDGPGSPGAPLPQDAVPFEEGHVVTPDGARLYYRKLTGGPITLIVPLDFALYDAMKQFADIATVITYDLRGRGRSSRVDDVKALSIEQDVRDLETIRAHFKADKFIPVGYSYLGKVVAMYAAAHPDRVSRVIQLGPVANRMKENPRPEPGDFGAPAEDTKAWQAMRAEGGAEKKPRELCEAQWKVMSYFMVGDPAHASRFEYKTMCAMENEWSVNFGRTMQTIWPTVEATVVSDEDLKKITMPVLTIHGTKDRNAPYAGGRKWTPALPDARFVTAEGAAHALWLDDPVTVFGAMRHFMRGEWPLGSERP